MVEYSEEERKQICFAIGQRIRKCRKEKGLTLKVLAEETGFSKSYLSHIENLKREPSIGTLTKIARILGTDALFLISGIQTDSKQSGIAISRVDEHKLMPDTFREKSHTYRSLAYEKKDRLMDAYIVEQGFDFPKNTRSWQGETFVYVLEGTNEFFYDGRTYTFNKGDAYYFDSSKQYKGRAIGPEPCKILVVFTSGKMR
jgi:transcriptional regulator with XRE-family HTH domain